MDEKALRILFDTYWSPAGWKSNYETPPDDFEYACRAGYMFKPRSLSHDEIVERARATVANTVLADVTDCFLASLSTRRLDLRSALGSFATGRLLPQHPFETLPGYGTCTMCGDARHGDWPDSALNFERYKWGGVRHVLPSYIALDLELFARGEKLRPTSEDLETFNRIIQTIQGLDPKSRPNDLEKTLSGVLKSNKDERRVLIEILGYCGILEPADHPSFFERFIPSIDRDWPPSPKNDWSYPVSWWRGADGINYEALAFYFPLSLASSGT